jgi:hypothetical protein
MPGGGTDCRRNRNYHEERNTMRHAFRRLVPTGILALVLGLMAFGATAAQAEPGAYWLVNGTDIGTTLLPEVQAENDTEHITVSTSVGKTPLEFLCGPIKLVGAKLHELGRFTGKIHYEGCITILNKNGKAVGNCKPKSPGATAGLIETVALEGLLKLHELAGGAKDELLEVKPVAPATAFVRVEMGPLCAIGNEFDFTGKAFLRDCLNEGLVDRKDHLVEEGPLTALKFGGNEAHVISGSAFVFLKGAHEGMTFAAHAG